jgi:hypothetical protein
MVIRVIRQAGFPSNPLPTAKARPTFPAVYRPAGGSAVQRKQTPPAVYRPMVAVPNPLRSGPLPYRPTVLGPVQPKLVPPPVYRPMGVTPVKNQPGPAAYRPMEAAARQASPAPPRIQGPAYPAFAQAKLVCATTMPIRTPAIGGLSQSSPMSSIAGARGVQTFRRISSVSCQPVTSTTIQRSKGKQVIKQEVSDAKRALIRVGELMSLLSSATKIVQEQIAAEIEGIHRRFHFQENRYLGQFRTAQKGISNVASDPRFAQFFSRFKPEDIAEEKDPREFLKDALELTHEELTDFAQGIRKAARTHYKRALTVKQETKKNKLYLGSTEATKTMLETNIDKAETKERRILYQANPWSWGVNLRFVEGGVDANANFRLKTHLPQELAKLLDTPGGITGDQFLAEVKRLYGNAGINDFWHSVENRPTWFSYEIAALVDAGYSLSIDPRNGQKHPFQVKQTMVPKYPYMSDIPWPPSQAGLKALIEGRAQFK